MTTAPIDDAVIDNDDVDSGDDNDNDDNSGGSLCTVREHNSAHELDNCTTLSDLSLQRELA